MIFTFLFVSLVFENARSLKTETTCFAYFECVRVKTAILKSCENVKKKSGNEKNCARRMESDWRTIASFEKMLDGEMKKCVEKGLRNMTGGELSDEKTRFCSPYLQPVNFSNNEECLMKIGKISNQCDALRSCCDPASRCEQNSIYTETGRTLMGLKEEVNIKMAECAQHPVVVTRKSSRILKSPPFSLCLDYLQCQKDAHHLQLSCFDPIAIDDPFCSSQFATDIRKMREKRLEAFDYLDKCVPRANVTREFMLSEGRPCRAKALRLAEKPQRSPAQNCHLDVSLKRRECAVLRDCCVQADVCERSALYAVISDEYLLRRAELRRDLEKCQNNNNNI